MNFNDIKELYPLGSKLHVISHGESVTGTLKKLTAPSTLILIRSDTGRPKMIDCEKIEAIDFVDEEADVIEQSSPLKVFQNLSTPLIYLPSFDRPPFHHREQIKSRLQKYLDSDDLHDVIEKWTQLDKIFEDAKENNCLADKQPKFFRQLEELKKNYPLAEVYIFAGDIYSACECWSLASSAYAKAELYPEAVACAEKISETKNFTIEALRKQLLNKENRTLEALRMFFYYVAEKHYHQIAAEVLEKISDELTNEEKKLACQGGYKILVNSNNATRLKWNKFDYSPHALQQLVTVLKDVGKNDPPFELSEVKTKTFSSETDSVFSRGELTLFKQAKHFGFINKNIYFRLAQVEDEKLRAALNKSGLWRKNIKVEYTFGRGKTGKAADHIRLVEGESLPPDILTIHDGILESYNEYNDYGKVSDDQSGQEYGFKSSAVRDNCLYRYLQENPYTFGFHIQFTLKQHKDKEVVRYLRLVDEERIRLNEKYNLKESPAPPLIDKVLKSLPEYQPLPPCSQNGNDMLDEDSNVSIISAYATDKLAKIPFSKYLSKYSRLRGMEKYARKFVDDDFFGTPEDVAKIKSIVTDYRELDDERRSEAWAFVAKLTSKVYERYSSDYERCNKNGVGPYWKKFYVSQFMYYSGDHELRDPLKCNLDVVRFFYNEGMITVPKGTGNPYDYFVKFILTFFLKPNEILQPQSNNAHLSCLASYDRTKEPRKLLIATFFFPDRTQKMQKSISDFIDKMVTYSKWREEATKLFGQLLSKQFESLTKDNFKTLWQKSKEAHLKNMKKFEQNLCDAAKNCDNAGDSVLNICLEKINEVLDSDVLSEKDTERVNLYHKVLLTVSKIPDKSTFEEKEEDYKKIIETSETFNKEVFEKPTKLSYENLRENFEIICLKAEEELKKLYESSEPSLSVTTTIIGSEPVQFTVNIENKENCQTAVNMKVEVESLHEGIELKFLSKKIGAIRGGNREEFLYEAILGEKEKSQGYIEVKIQVTYKYRIAKDATTEKSIERTDNVSLLNIEDYEEINNVYEEIVSSNSVPTESNLFYGRDEDINKIINMLKLQDGSLMKNRGIYMYGQRRAGKTSIMNHLKEKIIDTYGPDAYIIVAMGNVGECKSSFFGFLSSIISNLKDTIQEDHRNLYQFLMKEGVKFPCDEIECNPSDDAKTGIFKRTLKNLIEKFRRFARSEDKFIPLFLIDEFTHFYEGIKKHTMPENFMQFWKAFLENNPICTIIIGMDHMPQFVDEYPNEFACMSKFYVSFLKEKDAKDLANKPILLKDGSSRYKGKAGEEALSYIFRLTAGSAYLIVIFCDAFVNYLNERKTTYITKTVIDNFTHEKLFGECPILNEQSFEPQLNDNGKFSAEEHVTTYSDNKAVLTYIAVHADSTKHELSLEKMNCLGELSEQTDQRLTEILEQLTKRDVLTRRKTEQSTFYRIGIDLLRMWLLREIGKEF